MTLPFSHDAFLDVFAAFNRTSWAVVATLWLATAWTVWATLVTAGWLVGASEAPRALLVIPLIWSAIGTSAAILLGVPADMALAIAAAALAVRLVRPTVPAA